MTNLETVEEIKQRMETELNKETDTIEEKKESIDEVKEEDKEIKEEETNEPSQKKLTLAQRLENAYSNLNEEEREAWKQGWRPQEFFVGRNRDGSKKDWIDAKTFLDKSKDNLPVANDRIRELTKKIEELEKHNKRVEAKVEDAEQKGYEKALIDLSLKQRQAVELGDTEEFDKLKKEENDLINARFFSPKIEEKKEEGQENKVVENLMHQQPYEKSNVPLTLSPRDQQILDNWQVKNMWMRTDPKLAAYAIESEKELLRSKPYLSLEERLNIVEQDVKETFHNKFTPNEQRPATFDSGINQGFGGNKKEKDYSDLPANAKANCEKLINMRRISEQGKDAIKAFKQTYAKAHYQYN